MARSLDLRAWGVNIYTVSNAMGSHNWKKIHVIMQSRFWVGPHKVLPNKVFQNLWFYLQQEYLDRNIAGLII